MTWEPNWTDLIATVIGWLLGALGIGIPKVTPNRIANKE